MDTLIACFYEDQYRYFDKEADSSELLEWLVSTETITEEEANELEKNGFEWPPRFIIFGWGCKLDVLDSSVLDGSYMVRLVNHYLYQMGLDKRR